MPVIFTYDLTDKERKAVEAEMAAISRGGTAEDYLQSVKAGQREIDMMIDGHESRQAAKLSDAVPALIEAGVDPELVVRLAQSFALASETIRSEIQKLLGVE
jgi:hypothetical protein